MSDKLILKDKYFKFAPDSEYLNYEPVNMITTLVDDMAHKVAEGVDTIMIEACMAVDVDPNALLKTMKRVRAQETEIRRLEALLPPCKIGDSAWAIRSYSGTKKIMSGKVSEMYYVGEEMRLCIVVKNIARGTWGKDVFGSYEAALEALAEEGGCL